MELQQDGTNLEQNSPMVAAHKVTKSFESGDSVIQVVRDCSINFAAGRLTLLMGPSGCGKTTLISMLSGILKPTSGTVTVADCNIWKLGDSDLVLFRRINLGFVFQQYNLLPSLTAAENVTIPLRAAGVQAPSAMKAARTMLERVGLGSHIDKYPRQLSGGQQQRVAIARALVHNPKLVVCDEPTAALDAESGREIMTLLKEIASQRDRAVIVVTHDPRVLQFGDSLIEMSDGRITTSDEAPTPHKLQH
jgi:putative ABC transport system ATP-binding protein